MNRSTPSAGNAPGSPLRAGAGVAEAAPTPGELSQAHPDPTVESTFGTACRAAAEDRQGPALGQGWQEQTPAEGYQGPAADGGYQDPGPEGVYQQPEQGYEGQTPTEGYPGQAPYGYQEPWQAYQEPAPYEQYQEPLLTAQDAVASGVWGDEQGGCPWEIDADGTLWLREGAGRAGEDTSGTSPWAGHADKIFAVKVDGTVTATASCEGLFSDLTNLRSADLSGLDTSGVTDMAGMFYGCSSLSTLTLGDGWSTSQVENMAGMFYGCSALATLDVSGWDTSQAEYMSYMFFGCSELATLDASGWDTSKVTDMLRMFDGCSELASLDASGWDTSKVTGMLRMFYGCSKLASLDLAGWDTSEVEYMSGMFYGCTSLASFTVGSGYHAVNTDGFPDSPAEDGRWWSAAAGTWFGKDEIFQGRQGMPDTYTSEENVPAFRSHSLTLGGMVGVNFYCDLSVLDEGQRKAAYVEFELDGETTKADYKADFTNEEKTCHGFTCPVRSVQMADTITATLHYGDGKTVANTFSVRRYVDYVRAHTEGYDQKVIDLVRAIADYGHYMQPFLAAGAGWTVGREYRAMPAAAEITETAIAKAKTYAASHAIAVSGNTSAVAQLTYSLVLDAETGVYVYVRPAEGSQGGVSASVDGGEASDATPLPGGRYRVAIERIPAHKLGDGHTIAITVGGKVLTVRVSPLSYVSDVLKSDSGTFAGDDARKAVTSLYLYYKATMAYRGTPISAS